MQDESLIADFYDAKDSTYLQRICSLITTFLLSGGKLQVIHYTLRKPIKVIPILRLMYCISKFVASSFNQWLAFRWKILDFSGALSDEESSYLRDSIDRSVL